jgi:hypothetical protein
MLVLKIEALMADRVVQSQVKVKVLSDVRTAAEWRNEFERAGVWT